MENQFFYSREFKQTVVKEVLSGVITKQEASRKYGIKGHVTILRWIRKFDTSKQYHMKSKGNPQQPSKSQQELEAENKRLREELDLEQLRNRALNVMIDIAENQFKIPIRKKSGAKQLKK